ncbi:alkaline phosphatase family protein [Halorussus salinisoli]|uniref:alkaline phosphatase family protein n=1 Tax=Halorussus salinisoli TaxID=2558242 RepID=UPI0010C24299|nr:alkaline phosphatase family protein [Halorussus salinisoli]
MTRTFVLGIDGGSWRILDDLELSAFEQLRDKGTTGTLQSTLPPITYPAWKCYSTGKNPGKLGVFGFLNFDREKRANRQNDATHFDSAELWDYLSNEGKRAGVVNMPTTSPPHEINGLMIAGPNSDRSGFVTPANREPEITELGYVPLTNGSRLAIKSGDEKTITTVEELIESRFRVARKLIAGESFDFFQLTIYCTDPVQHHFWDGQELLETYQCLNQELETLLERLEADDEEWNVVVVSDHGFQPIRGTVYLDTWLEREGFLHRKEDGNSGTSLLQTAGLTSNNAVRMIRTLGLERLVGRLPDSMTSSIAHRLPSRSRLSVVDSVDWERSDAVFLMGGIYILDKARRQEIIEELVESLTSFTKNGNRVIDKVHKTDAVYNGTYLESAPDLITVSDDYNLLGFSRDGSLFTSEHPWIAAHEMEGLFIGTGPEFQEKSDVGLDIYDVAPTVLHAMDCAVPTDIDGSVRNDILAGDDDVQKRDPLTQQRDTGLPGANQDQMMENLKQLGYLE